MTRLREASTPNPVLLGLAYGAVAIPVAGWVVAQTGPGRIDQAMGWSAAWIHGLAASTFAVIFGVSAVINALVVTHRLRDAPRSYRLLGYPLWQAIVAVTGIGWLIVVALTLEVSYLEMGLGLAVAVASIGACVQAARRDTDATARRRARVANQRDAQSPSTRRAVGILRVVIPVTLGLLVVAGLGVARFGVFEYRDCDIHGTGVLNGDVSFYTSDCGDFDLDETRVSQAEMENLFYSPQSVDITTQGYGFGIPPRPIVIGMTVSD